MSHLRFRSQQVGLSLLAVALVLALGGGLVSNSVVANSTGTAEVPRYQLVAEVDDEVVLPARVAYAIARTKRSLHRAGAAIDHNRRSVALRSLRAVVKNVRRTHSIGMRQMHVAPVGEEETPPGPDSVVAILGMEQQAITRLTRFFDDLRRPRVIARLRTATTVAYNKRARMLNAVARLDPEGAGADYSDGMADTVGAYAQEVSAVRNARKYGRLTAAARAALSRAVRRSQAARAVVNAAFGGGE